MTQPRLYRPERADTDVACQLPENPSEVLGLVHDLEEQAARATNPEVRRQLLRAGCDLLDAALKQLKLPAAA